jgi:acetyl-CoA synthetase
MSTDHNLQDYEALSEVFEWKSIYADADWDAPDEINVAHEICDRHAVDRSKIALYAVDREGDRERIAFWELAQWSDRFANALETLGFEPGDRLMAYMPRVPERFVVMLGTLKTGGVFGAIDERCDPEGIAYRLEDGGARAVVTTPEGRETVDAALSEVPAVEDVIVASDDGTGIRRGDVSFYTAIDDAPSDHETERTGGSDPALLYYTSGTTGPAKGVVHGHRWIVGLAAGGLYAADLKQHMPDLYWETGDRGWLTAPVNSLGVWFWGHSLFLDEAGFDPERCADFLDEFPITVLSSTPALYRELRDAEGTLDDVDLDLHQVLSTGEPIDADLIEWGEGTFGVPIHDTYGGAETGNMIVNNYPVLPKKPASMGKPLPGVTVEVVDPGAGEPVETGETGVIAVRDDYPSFFLGYWEDPDRTADAFVNDRYLTGDLGRVDEEGYFYFEGRADDP